MAKYLRIAAILILSFTIILSCTYVANKLTDPATYSHTIEVLDNNRATVLALSAASAGASAAVSALPSDICSPLAEQLSRFTTWFLMILSVIYLEKYLLTIFGAAACYLCGESEQSCWHWAHRCFLSFPQASGFRIKSTQSTPSPLKSPFSPLMPSAKTLSVTCPTVAMRIPL